MTTFLRVEILALLIPIVAILVWGATTVCKMMLQHQERMSLIDRGIHPDYPPDEEGEHPPK
ncbi:MAG: hypothetical protein KJ645_04845 [Planctomycetes bacterium]|nr:hypothetical protein [Planctomycetota bacterium]